MEVNPLRKLWWGLGTFGVVVLGLYLFLPRGTASVAKKTAGASTSEWTSARCDRVLTDAYKSLSPERLGITSSEDSTLRDLNQWAERCGKKIDGTWDSKALAEILPADALQGAESERFLRRDAFHVRMCRMARDLVLRLVPKVQSDSQRAKILFDYVVQQVELRPAGISDPPAFSPFDCLLYGEGTAAERAWLFVELLRQVPIDAVVFLSPEAGQDNHPLVGVLSADEGCLLYDCVLGLPVPASVKDDSAPLFSRAATWKAATASDELFRLLDVGESKYPWSADRLKAATVGLVGTSSWWSARMARLQFQLQPIAGNNLLLSEPLIDVAKDQPGYKTRVARFDGASFESDKIRVWNFPEDHLEAAANATANSYWTALQRVFNGPLVLQVQTINNQRQEAHGLSNRPLKLIRVWQLLGKEETLRGYLAIRNAPSEIPSGENNAAAQFATFWVGLSQFEQGSYAAARETLNDYLRTTPKALRGEAAVQLIAQSLAVEKNPAAIEILAKFTAANSAAPERNALLLAHWKQLFGPKEAAKPQGPDQPEAAKPDASKPEEKPSDDAAKEEKKKDEAKS